QERAVAALEPAAPGELGAEELLRVGGRVGMKLVGHRRDEGRHRGRACPGQPERTSASSFFTAAATSTLVSRSAAIGSPVASTRAGTVWIEKARGSRSWVTSSQESGVDTVAPAAARTAYGATIVRVGPVCPVST